VSGVKTEKANAMTEFETSALELLRSIDQSLKVLKEASETEAHRRQARRDQMTRESLTDIAQSSQQIYPRHPQKEGP
jgi:hypothetical protein